MMATTEAPSNQHAPDGSYPDRLWEEYKLIQGKIDKIGDFQFKVKGWSATLLGAVLFGGVATSNLRSALLGGILIVIMFHITETRQRWLGKRLGRRATAIEQVLREFSPISDEQIWKDVQRRHRSMRFAPAVARTMADRTPELRSPNNRLMQVVGWFVMQSNDVFYWAQYLLLAVLLAVHLISMNVKVYGAIGDPRPTYECSIFGYKIIIQEPAD